jgi:thioredoxin 2
VATELAGRVKLVKVNVDDSPKLRQRFDVMAILTLMVLRRGQVAASGPVRRRPRACAPGWRRSSETSRTRDVPASRRREAVISGRCSDQVTG